MTVRTVTEHGTKDKRAVAFSLDWPGWSRGAKTAEAALETLEAYRARYRRIAELAGMAAEFDAAGSLEVVEDRVGTGSTDFWGISFSPSSTETDPMDEGELERKIKILRAAWAFFDGVAARVSPELQKGPRGGGRERDQIIGHVIRVESMDFAAGVGIVVPDGNALIPDGIAGYREDYLAAMHDYNDGKVAKRMRTRTLPFLLRHSAFHTLDHAWEMEDKDLSGVKIAWHERWGGPEVVEIREVETPVPTGDEVLVKVHASSVNRADLDWLLPKGGWLFRLFLGLRRPRSHTLGIDLAGTVEALGPEQTRFKVGDRVYGDVIFRGGQAAFAEFASVREALLQPIPEALGFEEAATLPHSGTLAVMGLRPYWGQALRAGDSILVVGASGNVGPFMVQIAKARGLRVTGVCRTGKVDFVRSLGADDVIDYTTTDYTKSGPYDRIIDVDAHRSIFGYRKALKRGGIYISMGGNGVWILSYLAAALTFSLTRGGVHMGLMPGWRPFTAADAAEIAQLIQDGSMKPAIDRRYPLSEVRAALDDVHQGRSKGKIVITVA